MSKRLNLSLFVISALIMFLASWSGPTPLAFSEVVKAWLGMAEPGVQLIVLEIRLPRILAAFLVGASLGLAGAALQGLLRNPLAEPGVLGVSASSSLAASLTLYYGWVGIGSFVLPLSAVLGALLATVALVWVGWRSRSVTQLILVGIALSSLSAALMSLLLNLAPNPFSLAELINWLLGSVANRSLADVLLVLPLMALGTMAIFSQRRGLAALTLGEDTAHSLGVNLTRLRIMIIIGTGLLAGSAVALAGVIGFVGIVAPHIARPWVDADPAKLLLPSTLLAGILLVLADGLVQALPTQNELQLGVVAALIGAPVFIIIVTRLTHYD